MSVLEGIEKLPWGTWHHAYGPAEDVPDCLRALVSDNHEERQDAQWELYGNLWHQGTIYEATAHAVPWLVALLDHPNIDRAWLLTYLGQIAQGSSYNAQHADLDFIDSQTPEYQEKMRQELAWVDASVEAIRAHGAKFGALLTDSDEDVCVGALFVIAQIPSLIEECFAAIRGCSKHVSAKLRAASILALRAAPPALVDEVHAAASFSLMDLSPAVRWAGAMTLVQTGAARPDAVQQLLAALNAPDRVADVLAGSPFADEEIDSLSAHALAHLGELDDVEIIDALVSRLAHAEDPLSLVSTLLYLCFGSNRVSLDALTEPQRRCLRALVREDHIWKFGADLWVVLDYWGLAYERDELAARLGV